MVKNDPRTEQHRNLVDTLRESERGFRAIIANVPMIIFTFDMEGVITFVAGKSLEFMNAESAALVGKSIFDLYVREPSLEANYKRALVGDSFFGLVRSLSFPDLIFEIWFSPLRTTDESIIGGSGVAIDVSDRYRMQVSEREQRALAEALRDTASALTILLDPDEVMNEILDNVNRVVPHISASIALLTPDGTSVDYMRGRTSELLSLSASYMLPIDGYMRETGKPCLIPDVSLFDEWRVLSGMEWIRSYLGVPILAFGEVVGLLNLYHEIPNFFTSIHAERLKAFADQASIAIQNAQLFDQIRRDAQQMAVLNQATSFMHTSLVDVDDLESLCRQIVEVVVREFGKIDCGLILKDNIGIPDRIARTGQYQAHIDIDLSTDNAIYETLREERTLYVHDVLVNPAYFDGDRRTRSRLVIPLRTPRGVIGLLDIRSMYPDAFAETDRNTLQAFAERAAIVIENKRLFQTALEQIKQVNLIVDQIESHNQTSNQTSNMNEDGVDRPLHIFVSYSRKDQEQVKKLIPVLKELGHHIWYDDELKWRGGQRWWDDILEQIRKSDLFLYLLSPYSTKSEPCKKEYKYASDLQKNVLPIRLSSISNNSIPFDLILIQHLDYTDPDLKKLIQQSINGLTFPKELPTPLPSPPPVPINPLIQLADRIRHQSTYILPEEQVILVFKLGNLLSDVEYSDEAYQLLLELKRRAETTNFTYEQIESALARTKNP